MCLTFMIFKFMNVVGAIKVFGRIKPEAGEVAVSVAQSSTIKLAKAAEEARPLFPASRCCLYLAVPLLSLAVIMKDSASDAACLCPIFKVTEKFAGSVGVSALISALVFSAVALHASWGVPKVYQRVERSTARLTEEADDSFFAARCCLFLGLPLVGVVAVSSSYSQDDSCLSDAIKFASSLAIVGGAVALMGALVCLVGAFQANRRLRIDSRQHELGVQIDKWLALKP